MPLFMCVECANVAHGRKWRPVLELAPEPVTDEEG
jgi:hypothetical protein